MSKRILTCIIGILICSSAIAEEKPPPALPSFNCSKGQSQIEKIICSDPELAALDAQMAKSYVSARKNHPQKKDWVEDQKTWLAGRDNCLKMYPQGNETDTQYQQSKLNNERQIPNCLKTMYHQRIVLLDFPSLSPLSDVNIRRAITYLYTLHEKNDQDYGYGDTLTAIGEVYDLNDDVTCKAFELEPKKATAAFGAYFGSTKDNFIPRCSIDISDRVPEVRHLVEVMIPITGDYDLMCQGTMRYGNYVTQNVLRLLTAVDAEPEEKSTLPAAKTEQEQSDAPDTTQPQVFKPTLEHWALQGNWEKHQYAVLQQAIKEARIGLVHYYQTRFHQDKIKAQKTTDYYLNKIIEGYFLDHMGNSSVMHYPSVCLDKTDLDTWLKIEKIPEKSCPYAQYLNNSEASNLQRLLGLAIINNYPLSAIQHLVEKGAPVEPVTAKERYQITDDSPLMLAANRPGAITYLLFKGAKPNTQNWFGKTALIYAIQEQNLESVKLLIAAGADVNLATLPIDSLWCSALTAGNRTPLMYAAWQGTPEIIEYLLKNGANRMLKDSVENALPRNYPRYYIMRNKEDEEVREDKPLTAADYLAQNTTLNTAEKSYIRSELTAK